MNAANVTRKKVFLREAKFRQRKKMDEKKKRFGRLSTKEIQEITDNAVPVTEQNHKARDEITQRYVSIDFP